MDGRRQRLIMISIVVGALILVALLVVSVIFMVRNPAATVVIRDIFIVFMALQSLLLGLVLVILIIQLARLINLLQNEIKPILESTNETVSTLRGTTNFLSDHLAEPVIKLNEYLAGLQQFFTLLNIGRGKPKKDKSQGE
jgi:membrane protein implicated in regulation of membrane protease activity